MLASFLVASGADFEDFTLSYSSGHRKRKETIEEVYSETREQFRDQATTEDWALNAHFDEKELEDTIGPDRSAVAQKHKRLNVTLSSPVTEGPVFVCSQICKDGTGAEAANKCVEGIEDLGVMDQVFFVTYDTTNSNSSPTVGAAAPIEHHQGCQILKCPCRHHILDLFGKNLSVVVSGQRTTGPAYPPFQRYAREWPNLKNNIDYTRLKTHQTS